MSGPTVPSASTIALTGMLAIAVPPSVLTAATRIANRLASGETPPTGYRLAEALIADATRAGAPGQATALAFDQRTSVPLAASINGITTASRSEEEVVIPALCASVAVAEHERATTAAWLFGFAIGAEVALRLARAWRRPGLRPFIPAGAVGQVGAALAASAILGLSEERAAPAIGLAAIQVSGVAPWGTAERLVAIGNAARVGVEAAYLGRAGTSGPLNAVETVGLMVAWPGLGDELVGLGERWIMAADADVAETEAELDPRFRALLA
jgi:2-methylcitrate dehydratase PrpD